MASPPISTMHPPRACRLQTWASREASSQLHHCTADFVAGGHATTVMTCGATMLCMNGLGGGCGGCGGSGRRRVVRRPGTGRGSSGTSGPMAATQALHHLKHCQY